MQPESGGIEYAGSDFPHLIQFRFSKKAWAILREADPGPIWMAWSRFGQMHLVRKQAGVQEPLGPLSGRRQLARHQFPTFRLSCVLPQTSQIMLCRTGPGPIWFWLAVSGLGQTDPVRKQASPQESCSPLLANASEPTRTGCGTFTGKRIILDASGRAESVNGPTCAPHTLCFSMPSPYRT